MDLNNCKFVVWGYKNVYHTHTHIHEAFYRTLKISGKEVEWLDEADNIAGKDFSNTFFITNHDCTYDNGYWPWSVQRISKIPLSEDCFYIVHGLKDNPEAEKIFKPYKNVLSWNVLTMPAMRRNLGLHTNELMENEIMLDDEVPFDLEKKHIEFRWATDLVPDEIESMKPNNMLSLINKRINWVGTVWHVNQIELSDFIRACKEDGVEFVHLGAGQKGVISRENNIKLIRESYMAPAISGSHHLTEGYAPCRIFKNISYGQFGITNNKKVNEIFENKLIYNPDAYKLYYEAKERLQSTPINELHDLMDFVARRHTYLNRIDVMIKAAKMII
jgi:hypothetical protein